MFFCRKDADIYTPYGRHVLGVPMPAGAAAGQKDATGKKKTVDKDTPVAAFISHCITIGRREEYIRVRVYYKYMQKTPSKSAMIVLVPIDSRGTEQLL